MARSLRRWSIYPITTRHLQVLRVAQVTPGMRRVTLGGPQLGGFVADNGFPVAPFRSDGFDDEFKLLFRHPDRETALGPAQADGVLDWPRDPHVVLRTYTARRWDPGAGELDVDFVEHGTGPATVWARTVQPGETIQIAGPKMSGTHPDADWTLIAGDETALPAIGRWLEEFPDGARAQVFIEVGEETHWQELAVPPGVEVTWLSRDGAPAGTTSLLLDALQGAPWWPGTVFAWVAGETLTLTPIRRWLRGEKGLAKEQVEVTGYWRRTERAAPAEPAGGAGEEGVAVDDADRLHELTELVPPVAIRVAATLGWGPLLRDRDLSAAELAELSGADAAGTRKLLRYLAALGLAEEPRPGRYRWTALGAELDDEDVAGALDLTRARAQRELGILALLAAVRTGVGDYARFFGAPFGDVVAREEALVRSGLEDEAASAAWVAEPLSGSDVLDGAGSAWISGPGSGEFARHLRERHPEMILRVLVRPSQVDAVRARVGSDDVEVLAGSPLEPRADRADVFLLTDALSAHPDADAAHILASARESVAPGGRVVVVAEFLDEASAWDHDFEEDLLDFAITGGGRRTEAEFAALADQAGLRAAKRTTIGWGMAVHVFA